MHPIHHFSKAVEWKPFFVCTDGRKDVRTDSSDTPILIENGEYIKNNQYNTF